MKQVLIRNGRVVVEEIPAPMCGAGEVLVRTAWSLLSPGTETTTLASSAAAGASGRAWARRLTRLGQAVKLVTTRPPAEAAAAIAARLEGPSQVTGYSLAGRVLEVGSQVPDMVPGQHVACAGAGHANHAEIVAVPRNLVVGVPNGMALEQAAFVTVGAIALQGLRQADLRLGESACVIGLGLIGQLSVMLLRASGCRVFGIDLDPGRVERALGFGLEAGWTSGQPGEALEEAVDRATGGHGADAVIVCAASASAEPARLAVRLVRRRGRVVLSGAVGLDLDRNALYLKEAELRIASAYGPGRYDSSYEQEGIDYPYPFVRWTENRNLEEFLRLAAVGALPLTALIAESFPLARAAEAYARLASPLAAERPLGVLLRYPEAETGVAVVATSRMIEMVPQAKASGGLGVAVLGPGNHARAVHFPALASLAPLARVVLVIGRDAVAAREAARIAGAAAASTDLTAALTNPGVALLLIATRHDCHAEPAALALEAGKAVFLEKPLALDDPGIDRVERALESSRRPFTLGLNRRFARDILALRRQLEARRGPLLIDYRVRAERLGREHWARGPEGGGRRLGEAVHMIDLLGHLVGQPRRAHTLSLVAPPAGGADLARGENFVLSLSFSDGSLATLTYTTLGAGHAGKERIEAHWDGRSARIDDFSGLCIEGTSTAPASPDKGHTELLRRFLEHIAGRGPEPIPVSEILELSRFVLALDREARGAPPTVPRPPVRADHV